MENNFDFSGWATKANLKCSDGRVIMKDAFKHNDGMQVPLVWNHQHNNPDEVLGHALLENREEGVYAYCKFNETESGKTAKLLVQHGDVNALSIYANQLKQNMSNVIHGNIREVSLVVAGANPGAFIDSVIMHGVEMDEEAVIYTGEYFSLAHADTEEKEVKEEEAMAHAEEEKEGKTVGQVLDEMTEEQRDVVNYLVGMAREDAGADDEDEDDEDDVKHSEGGENVMKHNIFDKETAKNTGVLSHSAKDEIMAYAKAAGSFQAGIAMYADEHELQHADVMPASGFVQTGDGNITELLPEYKDVRPGQPELVTTDQGWISKIINGTHKVPFSRIRTRQVDITTVNKLKAELRAKGYKKGTKKEITGNYNLVTRTTDPTTIYVKSALHRDDIVDLSQDFDIAAFQYKIDQMALNEEIATAILFGDGREEGDEDKIAEDKIRPIWTDDELYTLHHEIDMAAAKAELQGSNTSANFGENYIRAEAMVNTCLYAREKFKGSGTPDMYIAPHELNIMLLARDLNGRRIYSGVSELATALNVGSIITVEQMDGKTRVSGEKTLKPLAMIFNIADYSVGSTKGGQITHFTQFDIDYNQQKSLLETRKSGALSRIKSAIVIEEDVTEEATA